MVMTYRDTFPQSGDWERDFENLKEHVAMKTKLYPLLDGQLSGLP